MAEALIALLFLVSVALASRADRHEQVGATIEQPADGALDPALEHTDDGVWD